MSAGNALATAGIAAALVTTSRPDSKPAHTGTTPVIVPDARNRSISLIMTFVAGGALVLVGTATGYIQFRRSGDTLLSPY